MMYWLAYDFNECNNNTIVLYSISGDRGLNWADPQVYMADYTGGVPHLHFLRIGAGKDVLMFQVKSIMDELEIDGDRRIATAGGDYFRSRSRIYLRRSSDGGRIFDHGIEIPYQLVSFGKEFPRVGFYGSVQEFIQLKSGRILGAFCYMDPQRSNIPQKYQHFTGSCILSDDDGHSWRSAKTPIAADTPRGVMEMQIVETEPDRLFCLFRTKGGYLYQTHSADGGESWSPSIPSPLPSPESMPRMIKLASGRLLVAWNNISSVTQKPRHPMAVVLSDDHGKSWRTPRIIATETGENQLSNQGMIQLDDGRILLALSHYRATRPHVSDLDIAIFDEEWITSGK